MRKKLRTLFPFLVILCLLLAGCSSSAAATGQSTGQTDSVPAQSETAYDGLLSETEAAAADPSQDPADTTTDSSQVSGDGGSEAAKELLTVHFIDVGQGDSILIQAGNEAMLIDAGTNESGDVVTAYLESLGISHLDWVIGTHPHEDHIGGLDDVIREMDVDRVMMPPKEHTTKTFEDVLDAIADKNLTITLPEVGDSYALGSGQFTILGPVNDYGDDLNNWSVVLRLDYGNTSFLFTGDAESTAEEDILSTGLPVEADVLKVGHHGSDTSTSQAFLDAVSPDFAVISAGWDNDYGHPHQTTLDKLMAAQVSLCRTDLQGTVLITSNGQDLDVSYAKEAAEDDLTASPDTSASELSNTSAADASGTSESVSGTADSTGESTPVAAASQDETPAQETQAPAVTENPDVSIQVHITRTGEKYHSAGCSYLSKSDIPISLADAKAQGYTPCSRCNPPQ